MQASEYYPRGSLNHAVLTFQTSVPTDAVVGSKYVSNQSIPETHSTGGKFMPCTAKLDKNPQLGKSQALGVGEPTTAVLLNGHVIRLSKIFTSYAYL